MFGYLFFSALVPQTNMSSPSVLIFPLLQKFEFTAVTSFEQELIGLSSLGAGNFILRGIISFKICHRSSYGWAMVTKTVQQLKLLQFSKFNDHGLTMVRVITIYQKHMTK